MDREIEPRGRRNPRVAWIDTTECPVPHEQFRVGPGARDQRVILVAMMVDPLRVPVTAAIPPAFNFLGDPSVNFVIAV